MRNGSLLFTIHRILPVGLIAVPVLLFSVVAGGNMTARAQHLEQALVFLKTEIETLVSEKKYDKALRLAKRYELLTQKKYGHHHGHYAQALDLRASIHLLLNQTDEAHKCEARAALVRKQNKDWHAKLLTDLEKARAELQKRKAELRERYIRKRQQAGQSNEH